MPLRLRLVLLFALATAVLVTAAGVAFVLQLRVGVDASLDPGLRAQVAAVADDRASDGGLSSLDTTDTIVQVSTRDGLMFLTSPEAGARPLLDPTQRLQALAGEASFTTTVDGDRSRVLATSGRSRGRTGCRPRRAAGHRRAAPIPS